MKPILPLGIVSCCALMPVFAAFPPLRLKLVAEKQIQSPTSMANADDGSGRLFICDQRGKIHIFKNGVVLPVPFLDVGAKLVTERDGFDERGLLGLAFHPQYSQPAQLGAGRFYVFYSAPSPNSPGPPEAPVNCRSVVAEYRVSAGNPDLADLSSERILLSFDKPQFNHNGGQLDFGPDGFLYFSTGDGGSSNDNNAGHTGGSATTPRPTNALGNSQDKTNWMGKIHRIDPLGTNGPGGQYGIPADNPFVGVAGVREEIWAFGLRNPWRFSFDRTTGRLFCADVGQGEIEEVDIIERGGNFGWRNREGTFIPTFSIDAPPLTGTVIDPIAMYAHPGVVKGTPPLPQLGVSITGGFLYRGPAIPAMQGKYIFGDYSQLGAEPKGVLLGLEESAGTWSLSVLNIEGGNPIGRFIQAFGEDEAGEIFIGGKSTVAVSALDNGFPAGSLLQVVAVPTPVDVVLPASKDNSIYSEGSFSNALGHGLFAGRTGTANRRRALIKFDLSTLPAGSTIQSASLSLTITKSPNATNRTFAFHRLTRDWGEATSNAEGDEGGGAAATTGDATWAAPFHGTLPGWTTPGGDFAATASSTVSAGGSGRVTWTGLAADVQDFLDHPETNFGWILVGDESVSLTARRFASRQHTGVVPGDLPALSLTYLPGESLTHRQKWERQHYFIGEFVDNAADIDGDGQPALVEYAWNRPPKQANPIGNAFRLSGGTVDALEIRFWRDPLAVDLTYTLETSTALASWQGVVTSVAGAAPTGASFVQEIDAPGQPGLKEVVCAVPRQGTHQFVRLRITTP